MAENKKARTRYGTESPFTPLFQEEKDKEYARMDDEEEELVPTCPPPVESPKDEIHPGNVTMDGIATLLKQQLGPITANINALSAGVQMLDAKNGDLRTAVENRLKEMESRMDVTQAQVAKMDELVQHFHEGMTQVEGLIKTQVEAAMREMKPGMKAQNVEAKVDKRTLTAVIGNLEGIGSLAQAQAWLKDKVTVLQGPAPVQVYGKGTFQGMIFAEFKDHFGSSPYFECSSVARTTLSPNLPGPRSPFALMAGSPSREDHAKRLRHELGMDSPFTPLLNRQHANGYAPLEDENVDRVHLCRLDHRHQSEGLVSLDGLAAVVRREIQNAIRPVEGKLASLHTVLNTYGFNGRCSAAT